MQIAVRDINSLIKKKKNKNAIFLGCGPSIKDLNGENIKLLSNFDIWCSNTFIINKNIVPDFYHLEVKSHRNGPAIKRLTKEKKEKYKNVSWIIDQTRPYILGYLDKSHWDRIFTYKKYYRENNHGKYTPEKEKVAISCNASLSAILDIMSKI